MSNNAPLIKKEEVIAKPNASIKKANTIMDKYIVITRVLFILAFALILITNLNSTFDCASSKIQLFNVFYAMMNVSDIYIGLYFNRTLSTYEPKTQRKLVLTQIIITMIIAIALQVFGQLITFSTNSKLNCRKGMLIT